MARVIMIFSKVLKKLWEYAIRNAAFVLQVLPTSLNENFTSPFMMINGKKATIKHFILFGCLLYIYVPKDLSTDWKLNPRSISWVFLGFGEDQGMKCYIGYEIKTGKLHHSVNVWWDETFFPCREKGYRRITSVSVGSHTNSKDIKDIFPSYPEFSKIQHQVIEDKIV